MPPDTAMTPASELALIERASVPPAARVPNRGGSMFVVDFHVEGNSAAYRTFGWSGQEESHVWALRDSSELRLPGRADGGALTIEIDAATPGGHESVRAAVVRLFANGHFVGSAAIMGWTRLRFDIPDGLIGPNEPIDLRFEHPCFVRMDAMGSSREDRLLAICFYAVRLYPPYMKQAMDRFAPKPAVGRHVNAAAPSAAADHVPADRAIYRFRATDPDRAMLGAGWLHDPDGDAWADARISTLDIPAPSQAGPYLANITLAPLYVRSVKTSERINILLNGAVIGQFRLGVETCLAIPLPPELYNAGGALRLTFVMPDGLPMHQFDPSQPPNFLSMLLDSIEIAPVPPRHAAVACVREDDVFAPPPLAVSERFLNETIEELPDAVESALGISVADILKHYESLGDNCAFGLAQRKGGCEVLGLLRFGNTPLRGLMIALADEFRGAATAAEFKLRLPDGPTGEYNLYVDRYGIRWHTNVHGGTGDEQTVFAQQTMRLSYLRRKFYEALRAGRKIMTVSRAEPLKHPIPLAFVGEPAVWEEKSPLLRRAEVLPLFLRLNEYGTNTLLYLTRCANNRRSGTVELLAPGLMRGYVDDFVITPPLDTHDHAAWLRVAVNAWLLDQGPNASFRDKAKS